jgi:hypothetical protein
VIDSTRLPVAEVADQIAVEAGKRIAARPAG